MRTARARLIFSREARAFRRSGVPRSVRTRPFDTVHNNADNSLSLCFCSSWFEISFIVFPPVRGPAIGAFHGHGTADPHVRPSRVEKPRGITRPASAAKVGETASIPCGHVRTGVCNRARLKGFVRDAAEGERIDLRILNAKIVQ